MNKEIAFSSKNQELNYLELCGPESENKIYVHNLSRSKAIVEDLALLLDKLKKEKNKKKYNNEILYELLYSLWDAVKHLALSTGTIWSFDDHLLIWENGYEGYKQLLKKYGL